MDYPASKEDLARQAEQNGADNDVRALLDQLPDGEYQTPADVSRALGGLDDDGSRGEEGRSPGRGRTAASGGDDEGGNDAQGSGEINPIELQKHLKGVDYPANKQDLTRQAEENGADGGMRAVLDRLPDGEYQTPVDVNKAIGQLNRDGE